MAITTAPDMSFLNELYEEIEMRPPAIEARKLLVHQCIAAGWDEAARDAVQDLFRLVPNDSEIKALVETLAVRTPKPPPRVSGLLPLPESQTRELDSARVELREGYERLRDRAEQLQREAALLRGLVDQSQQSTKSSLSRFDARVDDLAAIIDGKISSVVRVRQPRSVRSVAKEMKAEPGEAVNIAFKDLTDAARWLRSPTQPTQVDPDGIREALVKRMQTLITALPEELKIHPSTALMHIEHEILHRNYVCSDTMYGDLVADIPRANFLVTEDNYAWDMEELAQAITSNGGVMRNPLSRQMFTPTDIRAIISHPLGTHLGALQLEQSQLLQGVRLQTIEEIENMSTVLLADMSMDQMESRHVVDAFMAFVATLPLQEQKALDELRVPAKDSHTGQAFDTSIGEAVKDALGNRVCFHKTGDLLRQAASHLRKSQ